MNAASVRILSVHQPSLVSMVPTRLLCKLVLLGLLVISSALAVVYEKDNYRKLFAESQFLHRTKNKLSVEKSQLLLEQSAWSAPARIQRYANQQMSMELPLINTVRIIKGNGAL